MTKHPGRRSLISAIKPRWKSRSSFTPFIDDHPFKNIRDILLTNISHLTKKIEKARTSLFLFSLIRGHVFCARPYLREKRRDRVDFAISSLRLFFTHLSRRCRRHRRSRTHHTLRICLCMHLKEDQQADRAQP